MECTGGWKRRLAGPRQLPAGGPRQCTIISVGSRTLTANVKGMESRPGMQKVLGGFTLGCSVPGLAMAHVSAVTFLYLCPLLNLQHKILQHLYDTFTKIAEWKG